MHTGDAGYLDEDGYLFVTDRIKDMIISGGENVYSTEVENTILTHAAVQMCAVIGIPDEKWGEAVHAVIVLRPGHTLTAEEVQAHCKQRIASYKCPRSVEFRSELPLSAAGKLLKYQLRKTWWPSRDRQI
jgi:acyl-CoA synthetase (AMP-forming)/AMP-acid ligase II